MYACTRNHTLGFQWWVFDGVSLELFSVESCELEYQALSCFSVYITEKLGGV